MNDNTCSSETLCVVITGASRGLGQAIAVQFAKVQNVRSLILIARTSSGLNDTKEECCKERQAVGGATGPLLVRTIQADLGKLETLDETIAMISKEVQQETAQWDRLIFVNNAGSLGFIGRAVQISSMQDIQSAIDLNVTSALWMAIGMAQLATLHNSTLLIVNISSLVAVQPFPSMALYSAGKAARDSFFQAMAAEEAATKTLNYAPGPLETAMTQEIRAAAETDSLDASLKPHYAKQLVDPSDSARVLVDLVLKDEFESGQHIDYYDVAQ